MDTPGPGSYTPEDNFKSVVRRIPSHSIPRAPRFGTNTTSMATPSSANYDPNYNALSVKRNSQSISFPKKKRFEAESPGNGTPGFIYNPNHDSKSVLNSASMHSFPRSERDGARMIGSLITPAPNSYDVDQSFQRVNNRKLNFTFRTAKREVGEFHHNTPGPDRYNEQQSSNVISRMKTPRSCSFGKSKRIDNKMTDTPGPDSYNAMTGEEISNRTKRLYISFPKERRDRIYSVPDTPGPCYTPNFGALSTRHRSPSYSFPKQTLQPRDTSSTTPSSATYRPNISAVRQRSASFTFGKSKSKLEPNSSTPGPVYDLVEAYKHTKPVGPQVTFPRHSGRNSTQRMDLIPGPNHYHPDRSMEMVRRKSPRPIIPKDRRRIAEPFRRSPGPIYDLPVQKSIGISIPKAKRVALETKRDDFPSPWHYNTDDSFVKRRVLGTVKF